MAVEVDCTLKRNNYPPIFNGNKGMRPDWTMW